MAMPHKKAPGTAGTVTKALYQTLCYFTLIVLALLVTQALISTGIGPCANALLAANVVADRMGQALGWMRGTSAPDPASVQEAVCNT